MNNIFYKKNILNKENLITPKEIKEKYKISNIKKEKIFNYRNIISNIIKNKDPRFLIICGPCSLNDFNSSIDYAKLLKNLSIELEDKLYIVMRSYLEKPRTSIGWKGLLNDPDLNGSCNINKGLLLSRELLIELIDLEIPLAMEILNPNVLNYIDDLFSWLAIGARTTESQIHRELVSNINYSVGFKNGTDGNILVAINAIKSSSISHTFLGINDFGKLSIIKSKGNKNSHIILRGGNNKPNYFADDMYSYINIIKNNNLNTSIIVDCSHDNSYKDYNKQSDVANSIINQINNGNKIIKGLMIESYIFDGYQSINNLKNKLKYGISITDGCIGWDKTESLLRTIYNKLKF